VIIPSATGTVLAPDYDWLNAIVYPLDEVRFRRDVTEVCPNAQVFASQLGGRWRVHAGTVTREADDEQLFERIAGGATSVYRPSSVPAVRDCRPTDAETRARVQTWIHAELAPALQRSYPDFGLTRPLRCLLEVAFADERSCTTLIVSADRVDIQPGFDPDWDVYDVAAGSLLDEVIEGRRHWGDLLLGGALRGYARAYTVGPRGPSPANVAEMFVYYALSYDESTRRAVDWELTSSAASHRPRGS
jgi:hypothetical protein